jgi:hypothetical protein
MKKPSYTELLKDPRWQRKRLEIMQLFGFSCEDCGDHSSTLHVHHGCYLKGRSPWDYPDDMYHVLCESCHKQATENMQTIFSLLGPISPTFYAHVIAVLNGFDSWADKTATDEAVSSFCELVGMNSETLIAIADLERDRMMLRLLSRKSMPKPPGEPF